MTLTPIHSMAEMCFGRLLRQCARDRLDLVIAPPHPAYELWSVGVHPSLEVLPRWALRLEAPGPVDLTAQLGQMPEVLISAEGLTRNPSSPLAPPLAEEREARGELAALLGCALLGSRTVRLIPPSGDARMPCGLLDAIRSAFDSLPSHDREP
ncbi:hypothetical protein [Miltoncostaea oceani]|uniref:hypothetical protein n=1 Tax=Miltoncostaea oceani TaxID=2843216 RepID=UPI001C3D15FB|nr:hypothetical protein [Miltoncostaea oceani]